MTDFEQPTGYMFIDDGRLPEEQPGMIWTPNGRGGFDIKSPQDASIAPETPISRILGKITGLIVKR
ncbi:hypothetical protein A3D14_02515 [Candidatus Saccharibacteria bacterium RIFCSPHIGHO2_02_FULL_47_12]|nr:MAG: hypothetical protein A3D14_02515 [Candidatus Saccharibacteria bacterium RIFCSPHIGHO2_02_FULL_47_12]